jgi:hypothetical protein
LILFGALFTAAVCWALGRLMFRRLENEILASVCGSAVLSTLVFVLSALKLAEAPAFLGLGVGLLITVALRPSVWPQARAGASAYPTWRWLFLTLFLLYGAIYLSNSLAPEFSPDGSTYHLGLVARYFRQHGFERLTTNMYGNLSQGLEMLFLFAFAFGRHSAAATVHCLFLLALPLLMISWARRVGRPIAGICAALLVFLSPLAGIDGVSAYNDVALATVAFSAFYLLEIWREDHDDHLLIPIGLLAGFCFAIKYTGVVAFLYALVILRKRAMKMLAAAAGIALPWLVKNEFWLGNPLSPFFNRLFPNPYVHVSFEDSYRHYLANYGLPSLKPLFWIVTVTGQLGGQIGPVFLLAPIALLSLRSKAGRHCLLAALFFLLPYPQNIGARFLIPVLPFVALGIAFALEFSQTALVSVACAAAILAWPRVINHYRAPAGGWQITTVPWQAALHLIPPETWLAGRHSEYRLARTINQTVPPTKRLWSTLALAEAYIRPDVLVYYYSAESEEIQDILLTPVHEEMQPLWNFRFTFAPRQTSRLRVIQTATSPDDIWSVGEARFYSGATEVNPPIATADPFPWEIGLALDRNPVTRWRSWESIHPGMHLDFDFNVPVQLDRVELFCSPDQWKVEMRIDGIEARRERIEGHPVTDLRRLATRTIKTHGIDYLMIGQDYQAWSDIQADPARWGLRLAAQAEAGNLYEIL